MAGALAATVLRFTVNRADLRRSTNLIVAHILEFRLFLDEPVLVLRAQRDLIVANLRLLRLVIPSCLILALPFYFWIRNLNHWYGRAPLRIGQAVVVSAKSELRLNLWPMIVVETPPVHAVGEVSWRVRPNVPVPAWMLERQNPGLRIPFPAATILGVHWLVWFSLSSLLAGIGVTCLE